MTPRHRIALVSAPFLALLLAACSSAAATPSPAPTRSGNGRGGGGGQPGAFGLVAAVDGKVVQVQSANAGQVAVDLSSSTKVTSLSVATKSDIKAGDCVTAAGAPDAAGDGLTAQTLALAAASGGSCTNNRRGNGSAAPRPSRSMRPGSSGSANAGGGNRQAMAFGKVSVVSGDKVTVTGDIRLPGAGTTATTTKTLTITLAASSKIEKETKGTTADIRTGLCLTANGPSNDTGAVQARTVTVFPATGGTCAGGNNGRRGGNGG